MASQFVEELIKTYVDEGLAESPGDGQLQGEKGELIELDHERGEEALEVYIGGVHNASLVLSSESFNEDLNAVIHDELDF